MNFELTIRFLIHNLQIFGSYASNKFVKKVGNDFTGYITKIVCVRAKLLCQRLQKMFHRNGTKKISDNPENESYQHIQSNY